MIFGQPYLVWVGAAIFLLLCLPAILKLLPGLRPRLRGISAQEFVIRACVILLIFLALADPAIQKDGQERSGAVLLVDTSDSMDEEVAQELLGRASSLGADLESFPFSGKVSLQAFSDAASFSELRRSASGLNLKQSNLEEALQGALMQNHSDILLISDGYQNKGDFERALGSLSASGRRVFPLAPLAAVKPDSHFKIDQLHAPLSISAESSAEIRVSLLNTTDREQSGVLIVKHDSKEVARKEVTLPSNAEGLEIASSDPAAQGIKAITAELIPSNRSLPSSSATIFLSSAERASVLLLGGAVDDNRFLEEILKSKRYKLDVDAAGNRRQNLPDLSRYKAVIFNNISFNQLENGAAAKIEEFVRSGGGFVMLGGSRSFGLGGYINTPIEDLLPVKLVPPRKEEKRLNVAVELIIDKSQSMASGQKLEFAKEAARELIRNLKEADFVGIIGFDNSPFEVVRLGSLAENRQHALERVGRLYPGSGTNLLPALDEGRRRLEGVNAGRKHMIILTDGKLPDASAEYLELVKQMRYVGITVSTVMLGSEFDFGFLRRLADTGGGSYYQTSDARNLPKIFLEDVKVAGGERTIKESFEYPVRQGDAGLLSTTIETYPALKGYVETSIKRAANLELIVRDQAPSGAQADYPLLASWEYGKGRSLAFTSDANGRWSSSWVPWARFERFWTEVIESLLPKGGASGKDLSFDLRHSVEQAHLNLDLTIYGGATSGRVNAEIIGPQGRPQQVEFAPQVKGRYQARLLPELPGKYEIRIQAGGEKLTPVAIFLPPESFGEQRGKGYNYSILSRIAKQTGGKVNPDAEDLKSKAAPPGEKQRLDYIFLLLAALIMLLEILRREVGWGRKFNTASQAA
ncbi:MAG: hypothetical protein DCC75_00980 [Proteobacteria bacterium]|nr:MAG: hypothetical protein DCC75_00980 [Pseudomonadota bacterium]